MTAQPISRARAFLRDRDPDGYAVHRALRAAVVIPGGFALASALSDDPQLATFAAFGGFALLLFVDFPGNRASWFAAYLMLAVTGGGLIIVGTLASTTPALAVAGMVVVAFLVLFAGVLSAAIAAAGRAALLTFILPVTVPGSVADIVPRLGGWEIAVAVAVPAAVLVWPPREHDALRFDAAAACRSVASLLTVRAGRPDPHAEGAAQAMTTSLTALRRTFRGTTYRPVGLTTGGRALLRLVDELEWLASVVARIEAEQLRRWPPLARATATAAAEVLDASAGVLVQPARSDAPEGQRLIEARRRLADARAQVSEEALARLRPGTESEEIPYQGHEVAYAADLLGETVILAAEADARPVLDRLLGRPVAGSSASLSPTVSIATSHIERHSVWLQNSVRAAGGLGLAVLLAQLTGAEHGFWVVLGALSILRSNALSTGSTALRAVLGTVVGFGIGGLLVYLIGTQPVVLWCLLPVAVLVAALGPEAISFAAGQAAFTVVVIVLFNIIQPVGWTVGLVRVQDVLLGCAASLAVGLLLWPRGAAAAIGTALAEAYRTGATYLDDAVAHTVHRVDAPAAARASTLAAGRRLDYALRQYLADRGPKWMPLSDLTAVANGATRLRLAGDAITALPPSGLGDVERHDRFRRTTAALTEHTTSVRDWYTAVADSLDPRRPRGAPPRPRPVGGIDSILAGLHTDLGTKADAADRRDGTRLLWTALYVHDTQVLEGRLVKRIAAIEGSADRPTDSDVTAATADRTGAR